MQQSAMEPIDRLGRWDGVEFVSVEPGSIVERRVHVMTHGWGPAMRSVVDEAAGIVRVWDPVAETKDGARFDRWFGPLAQAIMADDPESVVLAYSWIDDSATKEGAARSVKSQLRTTVNGQRLAVALRIALAGSDHDIHMIGYSHGAKVATVATVLVEPQPLHLTLLDSPDSLMPALGGALNDLGSYLRLLAPDVAADETFVESDTRDWTSTFVDNYPSHFGGSYGTKAGLGSVVDVFLDPERLPLESAPSAHAYSWAWYLETARDISKNVGYAWSPVRPIATRATATAYRQIDDQPDPFMLEPNPIAKQASDGPRLRTRMRRRTGASRVLSSANPKVYGYFWRRSGDLWVTAPISWHDGPDDAVVKVYANKTERARSVKGWSDETKRILRIPLGAARPGPTVVAITLESSTPAEVEVGRAVAVHGFTLPFGTEFRHLIRPLVKTTVAILLLGLVGSLVARLSTGQRRR